MAARARALKAKGVRVYDFTVGEPDQPTPRNVAEAGKKAIDAGRTKYTPANGLPELRAAVAQRYRADFGVGFAPEDVCVAVGGKQALALLYQALLDKGSEVIIPVPAWPTFAEAARLAGGTCALTQLSARNGFKLTARHVAKAISPKTRAVVVNSPSNPTGAVIDAAELVKIARLAKKHNFWLLYDDTYAHLVFSEGGAAQLQAVKDAAGDSLVVVGTASKSYCMTGWRIGWVIGSKPLIDACTALNSHSVQSTATFSQLAAVEALSGPQATRHEMAAEYRRRRDFIHSGHRLPARCRLRRAGGRLLRVPGRLAMSVEGDPRHAHARHAAARREGRGDRPGRGLLCAGHVPALVRNRVRGPAGGRAPDRRLLCRAPAGAQAAVSEGFERGTPVVLYLHSPREKLFGVLLSLQPAGIVVRAIDLASFEDWLRQEARGEGPGLALVTLFFPMNRVEKMEQDETVGGLEGFADRFRRATGRSVAEAGGVDGCI